MIAWMGACRPASEPSDPPTEPPEAPEEHGRCELCGRSRPLVDLDGRLLGVRGLRAPCVCLYDQEYPVVVDGALTDQENGCDAFERRLGGE